MADLVLAQTFAGAAGLYEKLIQSIHFPLSPAVSARMLTGERQVCRGGKQAENGCAVLRSKMISAMFRHCVSYCVAYWSLHCTCHLKRVNHLD